MGLRDLLSPTSPRYSALGFPQDAASRMPPRRVLWAGGLSLFALALLGLGALRGHGGPSSVRQVHRYEEVQITGGTWRFDAEHDSRNFGLTDAQCDAAFPDLYQELERASQWYADKKIREEDVHIWTADKDMGDGHHHGQIHAMIHGGELIIIEERAGSADRSRALSAMASMYRAINAIPNPADIPDIEFVFDIQDISGDRKYEDRVRWAWCRHKSVPDVWVMPDFDGWSYSDDAVGSYVSFRENVAQLEQPFEEKIPQLVWRGSTGVNHDLRMSLVDAAENQTWGDVKQINWMTRENVIPMQDFCKYQYLAHTEGNSWSGRLRYLQNCLSVSVIHELEYVAHYYPLLKPDGPEQNYVAVKRDFSDLAEKMEQLTSDPKSARRIAEESARTFRDRYLTPAAEACYWRRMFKLYAGAQAFSPRLYEDVVEDGEVVGRKRRGMSFERVAFKQKGSHEHGFIEPEPEDEEDKKKKEEEAKKKAEEEKKKAEAATPVVEMPAGTPAAAE